MLTMREVKEDGFGQKNRDWNRTDLLEKWRERWAEHANQRLAELDINARIDHRSFDRQGIELEPQNKVGPAASRMAGQGLESERLDEHREIARANGDKIIANPGIGLDAITRNQATFTKRDLAMFAHRHSDSAEQFDRVTAAVRGSPDLVALGKDGEAFTMLTMEPGPDIQPYHDRQIAILDRADWADWLDPTVSAKSVLKPLPAGSLDVAQVA